MQNRILRRRFVGNSLALTAAGLATAAQANEAPDAKKAAKKAADGGPVCVLETSLFRYAIGRDGGNLALVEKTSGKDLCADRRSKMAQVRKSGVWHPVGSVDYQDGLLLLTFPGAGLRAAIRPRVVGRHLTLELLGMDPAATSAANGPTGRFAGPLDRETLVALGVEELAMIDVPLSVAGTADEPQAACALALDLRTNVVALPGAQARLRATCYPRTGMSGARVAVVAGPQTELRDLLKEAVLAAPDVPHSKLGGPWADEQPITRGSYLFNFDGITTANADAWIAVAKSLGMTQIDFHGGSSFRFGDFRPNPAIYPQGKAGLKAAIDKLHAAGIVAGLHTYAFFIAKDCPWVTPKPDPRLASDAVFTLAESLSASSNAVRVAESTEKMSTITGFFVRNSVTLRIDEELIVYTGIDKRAPFGFTGCQRGAYGTKPASHAPGTRAYHLKECFGLFVPDPETTLLAEVAARTAETFNDCGFDMIYLDALDGEDILGGAEWGWHYGSKFVFEICKRLRRDALMEMSTFHHHLWCVRSRYCAWDHPTRSHKRFVDLHCEDGRRNRRTFLPGQLGWWAFKSWSGAQAEPTFDDDIEYLMAKCLGNDIGTAIMGIDPTTAPKVASLPRLASIVKRYEDLRHSGKVPASIKAKLREPKAEFTLSGSLALATGWAFRPVQYTKHRVAHPLDPSAAWTVQHRFRRQPARLRIEALSGAAEYDSPEAVVLADFRASGDFPIRSAQAGVVAAIGPLTADAASGADLPATVRAGGAVGRVTARSPLATSNGAWAQLEKKFTPPKSLGNKQALGVWIRGDGLGELLNLQLRSPSHVSNGIGDHYVTVDFTGWRYFELIEPEGERWSEYVWPYGDAYANYRESVEFGQVDTLAVWLNNLPRDVAVQCLLGPVKALPLTPVKVVRPSVTLGGRTLTFPVTIETGQYLEFHSPGDCKLFGPEGQLLRDVKPEGDVPELLPGLNRVAFRCETSAGAPRPRAQITVVGQGEPL